ncbi:hypothetical protein CEXT_577021 [Caerostris extrusa]|uniref:Uncharacterized protein n=1 Tax=Caerostris extrusa TaxID=172846 RepID=A0AAV4M646_CAEEX|nr:hypothetical protein CEXT_577021 [Caerostris extrusa]
MQIKSYVHYPNYLNDLPIRNQYSSHETVKVIKVIIASVKESIIQGVECIYSKWVNLNKTNFRLVIFYNCFPLCKVRQETKNLFKKKFDKKPKKPLQKVRQETKNLQKFDKKPKTLSKSSTRKQKNSPKSSTRNQKPLKKFDKKPKPPKRQKPLQKKFDKKLKKPLQMFDKKPKTSKKFDKKPKTSPKVRQETKNSLVRIDKKNPKNLLKIC